MEHRSRMRSGHPSIFRFVCLTIIFHLIFTVSHLHAQSATVWPTPIAGLYDCDYSLATVDSVSTDTALASISSVVLRLISQDASNGGFILMSLGTADTSSNAAIAVARPNVFVIDSTTDQSVDYLIGGKVTGGPANYQLTIFVDDSHTFSSVASGSSTFSATTDSALNAATTAALSGMLPLIQKVHNYQMQLRNSSSSYCINPSVLVKASSATVQHGGSTTVNFTVVDCDSVPLANRELSLNSSGGTLSAQTVQTNGAGEASATFQGGNQNAIGSVQASLVNDTTVTHTPAVAGGSCVIVVGSPDLTYKWKLNFSFTYQQASYSDTVSSDQGTTSWNQSDKVTLETSAGGAIVDLNIFDGGFSYNVDSILSGFSKRFSHSLTKVSSVAGGFGCPTDPWELKGSTENGVFALDSVPIPTVSYINNNGNISYLVALEEVGYDGYTSGFDWLRQTVGLNNTCETQSTFQSFVFNIVQGTINTFNQGTPGTSISFNGPPANPNSITSSTNYVQDTVTYDIALGATYQRTKVSLSVFMQPLAQLTGVLGNENGVPHEFSLSQNYPNPFNPTTVIGYQLPAVSQVTLRIYDVLGREVAILVNGRQNPGKYSVTFDGSRFPSGVYFYRLTAGNFADAKKLIVIK